MNLIKQITIFFFIITANFGVLFSQDIHFSQYFAIPQISNPAQTGNFDGIIRLNLAYRTQWFTASNQPFNTSLIAFDKNIKINKTDYFGFGFFYLNDISSSIKYSQNKFFFSFAYNKNIKNNAISLGGQVGYNLTSFNNALSFPNQFDISSGGFNSNINSQEEIINTNSNYIDFNIGALYKINFKSFSLQTGLVLFHINKPTIKFITTKFRIPTKLSYHIELKKYFNNKFFLLPKLHYNTQVKSNELIIGGSLGFDISNTFVEEKILFIGTYLRNGFNPYLDAFIPMIGIKYSNFFINLSYDVNISDYNKVTNSNGALEISVRYIPNKEKKTRFKSFGATPCDCYN